ncbi:MAG TPA: hypothetical protein VFB62_09600 [Polyangiaceae bacterium]|nr:hypothetical protein [Polyangiaceae bacterium]
MLKPPPLGGGALGGGAPSLGCAGCAGGWVPSRPGASAGCDIMLFM